MKSGLQYTKTHTCTNKLSSNCSLLWLARDCAQYDHISILISSCLEITTEIRGAWVKDAGREQGRRSPAAGISALMYPQNYRVWKEPLQPLKYSRVDFQEELQTVDSAKSAQRVEGSGNEETRDLWRREGWQLSLVIAEAGARIGVLAVFMGQVTLSRFTSDKWVWGHWKGGRRQILKLLARSRRDFFFFFLPRLRSSAVSSQYFYLFEIVFLVQVYRNQAICSSCFWLYCIEGGGREWEGK